jgi:hypothetical protein
MFRHICAILRAFINQVSKHVGVVKDYTDVSYMCICLVL